MRNEERIWTDRCSFLMVEYGGTPTQTGFGQSFGTKQLRISRSPIRCRSCPFLAASVARWMDSWTPDDYIIREVLMMCGICFMGHCPSKPAILALKPGHLVGPFHIAHLAMGPLRSCQNWRFMIINSGISPSTSQLFAEGLWMVISYNMSEYVIV